MVLTLAVQSLKNRPEAGEDSFNTVEATASKTLDKIVQISDIFHRAQLHLLVASVLALNAPSMQNW